MFIRRLIAFACAFPLWLALALPTFAAQGSGCLPTTGTLSGLTFAQDANAAIAALISSNSGASAPATDCSVIAVKGQVWLDTSATPNILKQYDGTSWLVVGFIDTTNHVWTPPVGGGAATIASASTTDLWSIPQSSVTVSGTTTITGLANASAVPGTMKIVKFSAALTLTYDGTALILPGAVNITTAAGDYALVTALTSSNVAVVQYFKANGEALVNPAVPVATKLDYFGVTAPAKFALGYGQAISRATYPDYLTAVSITQSATRTSGSAVLSGVADTSNMGAGMPIEGTGIQAGATILSVTSSSITMSANASSSGTSSATVITAGYGSGGSSSTVGVADCRGRVVAGRGDMGGTPTSDLTSTYFGTSPAALNAVGGSQSRTILQTNLPSITLNTDIASGQGLHAHNVGSGASTGAGLGAVSGIGTGAPATANATLPAMTGSTPLGGSDTPISTVQRTLIANCIVRVLQ